MHYYGDGLGMPGASPAASEPEWELFDLVSDPAELTNVYTDPAYDGVRRELSAQLERLQREVGDEPVATPSSGSGQMA